jgi:hypothetical protein
MNFVSIWRACSIVLTGAFGILGLLTEFKDKDKKITKWGQVSLAGILVSSSLGLIAQLEESSQQQHAKENTAKQTLLLLQNTDAAVHEIQRALSPLSDPRVSLYFTISCNDAKYKKFCEATRRRGADGSRMPEEWRDWPQGPDVILPLHVDFFKDFGEVQLFQQGKIQNGDLSMELVGTNRGQGKALAVFISPNDGSISLDLFNDKPIETQSNGRIRSTLDIPGTTFVLTDPNNELKRLSLRHIELRLASGEIVAADGPFQMTDVAGKSAYLHKFTRPVGTP